MKRLCAWMLRFYRRVFPYSARDAGVPGLARERRS